MKKKEMERKIKDIETRQDKQGQSLWEAKKHLGFTYTPSLDIFVPGTTNVPSPTLSQKLDLLLAFLNIEIVNVPGNTVCRKIKKAKSK